MYFSHLGVSLISVKPLTTENTENKTTPKICKITVDLLACGNPSHLVCGPVVQMVSAALLERKVAGSILDDQRLSHCWPIFKVAQT